MAATYEPIATTTITSGNQTNDIYFSSIPSSYTDLRIVAFGVYDSGNTTNTSLRFNDDYNTNYSDTQLYGTGSAAAAATQTTRNRMFIDFVGLGGTSYFFTADIFNYSNTSTYKSILATLSNDRNGSGYVYNTVGLWRSTSAISTLDVLGSFGIGSTVTLYGILKA